MVSLPHFRAWLRLAGYEVATALVCKSAVDRRTFIFPATGNGFGARACAAPYRCGLLLAAESR
jgi:hypothetical protein